jgi:lipoprotein Spr
VKKILYIILLLGISGKSFSYEGDSASGRIPDFYETAYYSQLLGAALDSIQNTILFETAEEWLGAPYRYAGDDKSGVDCSGFAAVLYRCAYDIRLDGSSADLFSKSEPLKKEELMEGDLVFFKISKNRISHVGVYLGKNKFVHATTQAGVIISDLDEAYYKKSFYKGGRMW